MQKYLKTHFEITNFDPIITNKSYFKTNKTESLLNSKFPQNVQNYCFKI